MPALRPYSPREQPPAPRRGAPRLAVLVISLAAAWGATAGAETPAGEDAGAAPATPAGDALRRAERLAQPGAAPATTRVVRGVIAPERNLLQSLYVVVMMLAAAKIAGEVFARLRRPPLLGELLAGAALAAYWALPELRAGDTTEGATLLKAIGDTKLLAWLGGLLVFFHVGLSSPARDLRHLDFSSFVVAITGAFLALFLGLGAAFGLGELGWFPASPKVGLFAGIALAVSSVGLARRALAQAPADAHRPLDRYLRALALVNDLLGLLFLSWLWALGRGESTKIDPAHQALALGKTAAVLAGALLLGGVLIPRAAGWWRRLPADALLGVGVLTLSLAAALFGGSLGVSALVLAYAVGVLLAELQVGGAEARPLRDLTAPVMEFLAPFLWIWIGLHVDPTSFTRAEVWRDAGWLALIAVASKALPALLARGVDRGSVVLGTMPRCTVTLVLAWLALEQGWIDGDLLASLLLVVFATTLLAPAGFRGRMRAALAAAAGEPEALATAPAASGSWCATDATDGGDSG